MKWTMTRWMLAAGLLLLTASAGLPADPDAGDRPSRTAATIEIALPERAERPVIVSPGEGRIVIDLPPGASYPADFEAASVGFLRLATEEALSHGGKRLRLKIARGVLAQIAYRPEAVRLSFASRFELAGLAKRTEEQYRLGSGDQISVTVFNDPDLNAPKLTVAQTGTIPFPLVGELSAAGLTVNQLAALLADKLEPFLVDPQVDVQITAYNSQWVMVAGEVRNPGPVALRGGTQLKEALTIAQGFGPEAGEWINISRKGDGDVPTNLMVDRREFELGIENPTLRHGDIITVTRAAYCYVYGEVRAPGKVPIDRGMTLLRAISVAGGLTDWANRKAVRVLRDAEEGGNAQFNLKRILRGRGEDPRLNGGEVIFVDRRAL